MDDLKKITIEEWDKIPKSIIDKCGKSYVKRLKKVIELNGERLEPFHLKEIEKELEEDSNKNEEDEKKNFEPILEKEDEKKPKKLSMRIIYNDKRLGIIRKKEIAQLRKKIKEIKKQYTIDNRELKKYKAKDFKLMSVGRAESIYEQKKNLKPNKEKKIEELEKTLKNIEKMDISEYLKYSEKKKVNKKKR